MIRHLAVAFILAMALLSVTVGVAGAQANTPTITSTPTNTSTITVTPTTSATVTITLTPTTTLTPTITLTPTPTSTPVPTAVAGPSSRSGSTSGDTALVDAWDNVLHRINTISHLVADSWGGALSHKIRNANSTPQSVLTQGGNLYAIEIINTSGAAAFVQIFDALPTAVALGTRTPDMELQAAAAGTTVFTGPAVGIQFSNAITVYSTTGENGVTGSASGVQVFVQTLP